MRKEGNGGRVKTCNGRPIHVYPCCGKFTGANFFVYYEIDDDESKHALALAEHGHQEKPNAWVLLERMA